MFYEDFLDGSTKELDVLTEHSLRIDQIGMYVIGELVGPSETDDRATSLRDLTEDDSKVWDGVLHGFLKLTQVTSGILQTWKWFQNLVISPPAYNDT